MNKELIEYIEHLNSKKSERLLKQRAKIKSQEWFFNFDNKLPNQWLEVNFMDVTWLITCGVAKKPEYVEKGIPFLSAQNTRPFKTNLNKIKFISEAAFEKLTVGGKPEKNDVLYTRVGNCGEAASIPYEFDFAVYVSLTLIKPIHELINHKFLVAFLNSNYGKIQANTGAIGIGLKNLNVENVRKYKIPLPPLAEQKAIVKKIEGLFSSLDSGIADLQKAQAQLKIYKQAVLKKAFEGELTKEWRAKQTNLATADELLEQIKEERQKWIDLEIKNGNNEAKRIIAKLKKLNSNFPIEVLPNNWKWTNFITSCIFVIDCHNKTAPYQEDGIYLIRTSNIRNGKLNLLTKMKYVSEETYKFWSKRVFPKPGDLIFTREAPMGEVAIIPKNTRICLGQRTMILRTSQKLLSNKYLYYNILSEVFQQRFKKDAIGTGVKHLRVGDVESLSFPLCSNLEQQQIVKEIESRLSVCDAVEKSIAESLAKATALRQSILKKAFEGKLLSTAEIKQCKAAKDYEPASVLLERIREEKKK